MPALVIISLLLLISQTIYQIFFEFPLLLLQHLSPNWLGLAVLLGLLFWCFGE